MSGNNVILLVEDNPDDVELTLLAFEESHVDHDIVVVKDGEEALDYLFATGKYVERSLARFPQVVLLDLNLPRVSGLDTLKRIRSDVRTHTLPVVILTSSAWEKDVLRSYDTGANSFVQKPVDFTTFLETARQLGTYWLGLNRAPSFPTRSDPA